MVRKPILVEIKVTDGNGERNGRSDAYRPSSIKQEGGTFISSTSFTATAIHPRTYSI